MNKEEFKKRWESDEDGGGITFNDIADCAVAWGISQHPRTQQINRITCLVLKKAGTDDAEEWKI